MTGPKKRRSPLDTGSRRKSARQGVSKSSATLSDPARPFVVKFAKSDGAIREHSRYSDRSEADEVVRLLNWAGAAARVEVERS